MDIRYGPERRKEMYVEVNGTRVEVSLYGEKPLVYTAANELNLYSFLRGMFRDYFISGINVATVEKEADLIRQTRWRKPRNDTLKMYFQPERLTFWWGPEWGDSSSGSYIIDNEVSNLHLLANNLALVYTAKTHTGAKAIREALVLTEGQMYERDENAVSGEGIQ